MHPICLLKDKSPWRKLAQIGFSSWCKLASVYSLAVYCAKAVLVGSIFFNHVEADKKSANFYLHGLVGGTIILAQYLRIVPIVIPTLLVQFIAVLVGSIVVNFFFEPSEKQTKLFCLYKQSGGPIIDANIAQNYPTIDSGAWNPLFGPLPYSFWRYF